MAAVPAMAAETVKVSLPAFDVTLNGVKVDNADSQYPLLVCTHDLEFDPVHGP